MKQQAESSLLVHAQPHQEEYQRVTPETAGWEHLHFAARRFAPGEIWRGNTGACEYGLVVLGGCCSVESSCGNWKKIGRRPDVFHGLPYALYLPCETEFTVTAFDDGLDLACGWCRSDGKHPPRLVTPGQ